MSPAVSNRRQQQEVFDRWLTEHRGLLFKVVRAHAFTPHDRDDLFQEISTQIWHSILQFRGEAAVTTWLYRVSLHCALAWARREKRHRNLQVAPAAHPGSPAASTADGATTDPPRVLQPVPARPNSRLEWLYDEIAQLDDVDRALTLLLLDGFSHREMAATLGLTETNVGVKIHRIKLHLAAKSREVRNHGL